MDEITYKLGFYDQTFMGTIKGKYKNPTVTDWSFIDFPEKTISKKSSDDSGKSYVTESISNLKKTQRSSLLRKSSIEDNHLKSNYTLEECLDCFNDLCDKNIGEIYLGGSVALFLQGKITRCSFGDLDVIAVGEYTLDDDIYEDPYKGDYPPDLSGAERKSLAFNNVKLDLFSNIDYINPVSVEYSGKTYLCEDYKDIIKAKLRMVLPKVKDLDELLGKSFEITYK